MGELTILQYLVFDIFFGGEMIIQVNFARYSVIKPCDGDEIPYFHEKCSDGSSVNMLMLGHQHTPLLHPSSL